MIASLQSPARLIGTLSVLLSLPFALNGEVENYTDLTLPADSYWNGSDLAGSFRSGSSVYYNNYDTEYNIWTGFAYSNSTNGALGGWDAQYTAATLGGMNASGGIAPGGTYAVGFYSSYNDAPDSPSTYLELDLSGTQTLDGLYVTNSLYAYTSMLEGDGFAKKFGGASGDDKDWLLLTITGRDAAMNAIDTVDVYLADYRSEDNALDYILNYWLFIDLSSLGVDTRYLSFSMSSSDNGAFGMNTPAYFALGGLEIGGLVPEPATAALALSLAASFILLRRRARQP